MGGPVEPDYVVRIKNEIGNFIEVKASNYMCIIFHDWEELERTTEAQIKFDVQLRLSWELHEKRHYPENFPMPPTPEIFDPTAKRLFKKVCLSCGARVDTITPYIKQCEKDFLNTQSRLTKAKEIFNG